MMHVRYVCMTVPDRLLPMRVRMRLPRRYTFSVRVLVMIIMGMQVRMLHRLMFVLVFVHFAKVEPDFKRHQRPGSKQLGCLRLPQVEDRG